MLKAFYCTNSTENNNHCKSREEIQRSLNFFYIHFLSSNYYIQSPDYKIPVKNTVSSRLLDMSISTVKSEVYFYKPIEFTSDDGFLLESKETINSYSIDKAESSSFYNKDANQFLLIMITLDNITSVYGRSYTKIQKVAADVGGFF